MYFFGIVFIPVINKYYTTKRAKYMLLLTIASLAIGGLLMTRLNEEKELYAPKGYLVSLQSRPRNVYSWY